VLYTKLALVTCAFYLAISILLDAAVFGMALWKGSFGVSATKTGWLAFFGIAWLMSFLLSWRIVIGPLLARIQELKAHL
jgi:hypothetical protein